MTNSGVIERGSKPGLHQFFRHSDCVGGAGFHTLLKILQFSNARLKLLDERPAALGVIIDKVLLFHRPDHARLSQYQ